MPKLHTCLSFDDNAEEAADFYMSVFPDARKVSELRNGENGPGPKGTVLALEVELQGQLIALYNGGPSRTLSEAVSLVVTCEDQGEIDHFWAKLGEGGTELGHGWLRDKFGLCWQVVPRHLGEILMRPAAMEAMMGMAKLDKDTLEDPDRVVI